MMQLSFSNAEHAGKRKQTRQEMFPDEMEQVAPRKALVALIEPHYPKAGRDRHPYALETMPHIHLLRKWYALGDPEMEEALYEIALMRQFSCLSLLETIPWTSRPRAKSDLLDFIRSCAAVYCTKMHALIAGRGIGRDAYAAPMDERTGGFIRSNTNSNFGPYASLSFIKMDNEKAFECVEGAHDELRLMLATIEEAASARV